MAQAPVRVPLYPDVPQAPGVPSIFRAPQTTVFPILLLQADIATVLRAFEPPQWGIFSDSGYPICIPDTVVSIDFRREWRISDFPLEQGAFQTYDKVAIPFDVRVRFGCSGKFTPKGAFISQLDAAAGSLETVNVITPDAIYTSVNITHYDYQRDRTRGLGVMLVDVWLQEVRVNVQTSFTNTKEATGQADINRGTVQPVEVSQGANPGFKLGGA